MKTEPTNTEPTATYEDISKALGISRDRYVHIVRYVMQMLKDYQGIIVDFVKEIPLNLKGKERHFAIHIIGHSSSPVFSRMNDKEKAGFIRIITEALKISQEKAESIIYNMTSETMEEIRKGNIPTVIDTIKKVIDSSFTENEKDYLLFTFGLAYT